MTISPYFQSIIITRSRNGYLITIRKSIGCLKLYYTCSISSYCKISFHFFSLCQKTAWIINSMLFLSQLFLSRSVASISSDNEYISRSPNVSRYILSSWYLGFSGAIWHSANTSLTRFSK